MKLFFDDRQLLHTPLRELHNGDWVPYAENVERPRSIARQFADWQPVRDFGMAPLLAVHDADYLSFLERAHGAWVAAGRSGDAIGYTFPIRHRRPLDFGRIDAELGAYSYDAGTPVAAGTWQSAYWSAQGALTALDHLAASGDAHGFALCRPPGHHAGRDYMGGYCYLNNAAIAARAAGAQGLGPVAILDVDYHHGNGTQDIFYEDPGIFFASIHADPRTDYPFYWGHADETGAGEAMGSTLNLPLPRGTDGAAYVPALDRALDAISAWGARFLIVSFGADTHSSDPISSFALEREDYGVMAARIAALGVPTLIVMEGGYAVGDLGLNVAAFLAGFSG
ncbi:acetoin utilization deacetylase AcuC-like enzyme [Sphingopyxis panaciterrae]|uniref:histone deacetylase family protein n=1 Tax=Sphingopyxis panaciterrae TaxID=363841 RepID=UPI00141F47F3|nr:histone deacetylase family protein [Sphingopyxis panaciterrae]NIJ38270.1 acetoin utilization deacetylase AcuC-like enzyme [Sphingopyxis panaciterrae]